MRVLLLILYTLLAAVRSAPAVAQEADIVVRGTPARVEIERVLNLDNLDVELLGPRHVSMAMTEIRKGRAPADFWTAYQAHVRAWRNFAVSTERARSMLGEPVAQDDGETALRARARSAIDSTFDEVERIARSYGARVPIPQRSAGGS